MEAASSFTEISENSKEKQEANDTMELQDCRVGVHSGIPESSMSHIPGSAPQPSESLNYSRCILSGNWRGKLLGAVIMTLVVVAVISISVVLSTKDTGKSLCIINVAYK